MTVQQEKNGNKKGSSKPVGLKLPLRTQEKGILLEWGKEGSDKGRKEKSKKGASKSLPHGI